MASWPGTQKWYMGAVVGLREELCQDSSSAIILELSYSLLMQLFS